VDSQRGRRCWLQALILLRLRLRQLPLLLLLMFLPLLPC
jgi:hypothetical protein